MVLVFGRRKRCKEKAKKKDASGGNKTATAWAVGGALARRWILLGGGRPNTHPLPAPAPAPVTHTRTRTPETET